MSSFRYKEIQRTIFKLENPYPEDNIISTYSDYLKLRDFLHYNQYNPRVLLALLQLIISLWKSQKRINRLSLIQTIKRYGFKDKKELYPLEIRLMVFELFRLSFDESGYLNPKQIPEIRKLSNSCLINLGLTEKEELWLTDNAFNDDTILNRVLRYPVRSSIISKWAREHFYDNRLRTRRPEILSWIIDEVPDYEIAQEILLDDFEYLNSSDIKAIKDYDDEMEASRIIGTELSDFLPKKTSWLWEENEQPPKELIHFSNPELTLSKRFYGIPLDSSKEGYLVGIPDFKKLRKEFYCTIDRTYNITMLWAVYYSRLSNDLKTSLFKKYYTEETYYTFFKLIKKMNNIKLLIWLRDKE